MPTLQDDAVLVNVKRSFDVYAQALWGATYPLDFEGHPFNDAQRAEWFQVRTLGPARPGIMLARAVSPTLRAQGVAYTLQVSIFVRPAMQAVADRLQALRDVVLAGLIEFTRVPVKNYAGDGLTAIGNMIVREVTLDQEVPAVGGVAADDLQQWTVSASADWVETYTAS